MGILADALPWLTDAGASAAALLAVLGLAALLLKTRPVKWLWRTVVTKPATGWLQATIRAELEPMRDELKVVRNEVKDAVATDKATSAALVDHMNDEAQRDELRDQEMNGWRGEVRQDIEEIKDGQKVLHSRIDQALVAVAAGNPEIHPGAMDPEPPGV